MDRLLRDTGGDSVTFEITDENVPVQVNAVNPITPRYGSVQVTKTVTGETAGLVDDATFQITLNCGPGRVYQLTLADGGSVTQGQLPAGSSCTAVEAPPDQNQLIDESFAWDPPVYDPTDATVNVVVDQTAPISVQNPIRRVFAPVRLVKTLTGEQGVVDPARMYPITWSCTYGGAQVAGGTDDVTAVRRVWRSRDVPVTALCTATEGDLGPPSTDPAYRWLGRSSPAPRSPRAGPNTITVANTLARDFGTVGVRKRVTGATEGYVNLGDPDDKDFTLHGSCSVPADPTIPTRYADGTIADGGEEQITAQHRLDLLGLRGHPEPGPAASTLVRLGAGDARPHQRVSC